MGDGDVGHGHHLGAAQREGEAGRQLVLALGRGKLRGGGVIEGGAGGAGGR